MAVALQELVKNSKNFKFRRIDTRVIDNDEDLKIAPVKKAKQKKEDHKKKDNNSNKNSRKKRPKKPYAKNNRTKTTSFAAE